MNLKNNELMGLITLFLSLVEHMSAATTKKSIEIRIQQCKQGCLEKFAIKEHLCQQRPECSASGWLPSYKYKNLSDALYLLCWDECAKPPPPKLNKTIRETWSLRTVAMLQQDSLVLVDVSWTPLNTPNQCLVTWEVAGGGLMGNLLTETSNVQLSLWPDTKYRVQVTCKHKLTGSMSRSLPLNIDTSEAITTHLPPTSLKTGVISTVHNQIETSSLPTTQVVSSVDDDQSSESIKQHTNFIFNWHQSNGNRDDSQLNDVEKLKQKDFNLFTIATLSDMQRPLIFGALAGTLLLGIVLSLYVCIVRSQGVPADKAALIDDDGCRSSIESSTACDATNYFGGGPYMPDSTYSPRSCNMLAV